MKCNKNPKHRVSFHKYNTFEYYYCNDCKEEILISTDINPYTLELEFNNKLNNYLDNNLYFLEYIQFEKIESHYKLIAKNRLSQKKLPFEEINIVTKKYINLLIQEYRSENNIIIHFE